MDEPSSTMEDFRTKMCIFNALDALRRRVPFDKITVTQICA